MPDDGGGGAAPTTPPGFVVDDGGGDGDGDGVAAGSVVVEEAMEVVVVVTGRVVVVVGIPHVGITVRINESRALFSSFRFGKASVTSQSPVEMPVGVDQKVRQAPPFLVLMTLHASFRLGFDILASSLNDALHASEKAATSS